LKWWKKAVVKGVLVGHEKVGKVGNGEGSKGSKGAKEGKRGQKRAKGKGKK
jgi:hypothetical protein